MSGSQTIKVTNNFFKTHRNLLVYNSYDGEDAIISWKEERNIKEFEIPQPGNFLLITVAPGPGDLEQVKIDLPDNQGFIFKFMPLKVKSFTTSASDSGTIRIPPGPPTWRLQITQAAKEFTEQVYIQNIQTRDSDPKDPTNVTVGDDPPGQQ